MEGNLQCSICCNRHALSLKLSCNHEFCAPCILKIYHDVNTKCPLCRSELPNTYSDCVIQVYTSFDGVDLETVKNTFPILCMTRKLEEIKKWVDYGADVNKADEFNQTALHYASVIGDSNIVKLLLDSGADVKDLPLDVILDSKHATVLIYILDNTSLN